MAAPQPYPSFIWMTFSCDSYQCDKKRTHNWLSIFCNINRL